MFLGTASGQGLIFLASPLLTRFYDQTDFGFFAIFLSTVSIFSTILTLRYELCIVSLSRNTAALLALRATIWLSNFLGLLSFVIAILWPSAFLPMHWSHLHVALAILTGLLTAQITALSAWYSRLRSFRWLALLKIFQNSGIAATSLLAGYYGWHSGLLLSQASGLLLAFFLCFPLYLRLNTFALPEKHFFILKQNIKFPKYLLLAASIDIFSLQLPVYLLSSLFSISIAGEYSLAWRVLIAPVTLISTSLGQVFFQRISKAHTQGKDIRAIIFQTWKILAFLGAFPFLLIFFYGAEIFSFTFGMRWEHAGYLAQLMAPMLFAIFISSPTSSFYTSCGLQKYSLFFCIASLFLRTSAIYIGSHYRNIELALILLSFFEVVQILWYNFFGLSKIPQPKY